MSDILASYCISNNMSLELRKIDYAGDEVLITENGENPKWYDLYLIYNEDTEEQETGFFYGDMPVLLSEFMRV